ncbi:hypothetical protein RA2_03861 [Roseovarius sp. A-2]|uniref:hypothetical protein n=1 Tax=Roseovarius sp. A-2 TaxID=1570360 RepID=UPI0009B522B5|nr:hypothetical protein [Roseovarius sp. A-2]GAW36786.1 hypothetical protein RA2_03861 [Roseovarius sp. A-2]
MLWLHIGMPKTGTTALQGYLHAQPGFLEGHGIRYMTTGRDRGTGAARLICHNAMAVHMSRGWQNAPQDEPEDFAAEYAGHSAQHCILSSEMFFGRDLPPLQHRFLSRIDAPVRVILYLRRFDDFIEADYKQRAKNAMQTGGVDAFVARRLEQIESDPDYMNLDTLFERIETQIPEAEILPRLYLRDEMAGQDVIPDFLSALGVAPEAVTLPRVAANRSLSRLASEALGLFDERAAGFDKKARRRIGRLLQQSEDPMLFASGDVLRPDERQQINDTLEARNAAMRQRYFPDRVRLFPPHTDLPEHPPRGHSGEVVEFQHAVRAILKLIRRES